MISWAATLWLTKPVLLVKVAEAAVVVLAAVAEAGVVVTVAVVVAEEAEEAVVAVVVEAVAVTAVIAAVVVAETGAGNRFSQKSRLNLRNGEPQRLPVFHFWVLLVQAPLGSSL
jgi:hypothetical protein